MKKALFNLEQEVIAVESITDCSHVGLLVLSGSKLQLVQVKGGFQGIIPFDADISRGRIADSKLNYLLQFKPEPEIFVFDTLGELIEWLKS